ncbi:unnamed protein product [Rotaria magnacalcarata]|uniref:Myb-like domain-containing protein n=1 Tax=Rotaria magnacalcarata TaxID=392030 RepID=A0A820HRP6_9BILA|nr:unnamed protein product [Rotaria magnacalcarata]
MHAAASRSSERIDNDAAVRLPIATRTRRAVVPVTATEDSSQVIGPTAGIHAIPLPIRQFERLSKDVPVKQAKTGLWTEIEITELRQLISNNTNHAGTVSWVKVEKAWKLVTNLPERSKASLSSKWYDIKTKSTTLIADDTNKTQGSADTNPDNTLTGFASNVTTTEAAQTTASNILGIKTVARDEEENQRPPVDSPDALIQLTFRKNLQKARKIGCQMTLRKPPNRVSGQHIKPIIGVVDGLIKSALLKKGSCRLIWNQLSVLVFAGALTVSELGNQHTTEKAEKRQAWFSSSYRECDNLRRVIGKATAELRRRKRLRKKKDAQRAPTM